MPYLLPYLDDSLALAILELIGDIAHVLPQEGLLLVHTHQIAQFLDACKKRKGGNRLTKRIDQQLPPSHHSRM
jgi:hypothetical protein